MTNDNPKYVDALYRRIMEAKTDVEAVAIIEQLRHDEALYTISLLTQKAMLTIRQMRDRINRMEGLIALDEEMTE